MTAEIAIMNKEAVALAADSAVTFQRGDEQKIFTSANKIFALSKYHPVGIMIYGTIDLIGVPWEVIIKIYRNRLDGTRFDTLEQYADHFIQFLSTDHELFPESQQEQHFAASVRFHFGLIAKEIREEAQQATNQKGQVSESEVRKIALQVIRKHHDKLKNAPPIPNTPAKYRNAIKQKYEPTIDKIKAEVFPKLSKGLSDQLTRIALNLFTKCRVAGQG